MAKINFHFESSFFTIPNKRKLKKHIEYIFNTENKIFKHLNIIFCSDKFLLKINTRYLNHDFYTDVITFDLSQSKKEIIGEIYISVDRVKENAGNFNNSFMEELYTVIIHGILHLCGYTDKATKDLRIMSKTEKFYFGIISSP